MKNKNNSEKKVSKLDVFLNKIRPISGYLLPGLLYVFVSLALVCLGAIVAPLAPALTMQLIIPSFLLLSATAAIICFTIAAKKIITALSKRQVDNQDPNLIDINDSSSEIEEIVFKVTESLEKQNIALKLVSTSLEKNRSGNDNCEENISGDLVSVRNFSR